MDGVQCMLITHSFYNGACVLVCFVVMGGHLYVSSDLKLLSRDACCLAFAVILIFYGKFHSRVLVWFVVV
jgi:hypothetical protein